MKCLSTSSGASPTASKICAPQYEGIVEIPIFEIVFSSALAIPLIARACASSFVMSSVPSATSASSASSITYGLTAAAP